MDKAEGKRTAENEDEGVKKLPRVEEEEENEDEDVKKLPRLDEEDQNEDEGVKKLPRADEEEENEDEEVKKLPRLDEEEENEDEGVKKLPRADEEEENEDEKVQKQPRLDEEEENCDEGVKKLPRVDEEEENDDKGVKKLPRVNEEEENEDEEVKKQPRLSSDEEEENDQDDKVQKQPRLSSDEEEESEDERVKKQPRLDEEEESDQDEEVQKQPRLSSDEEEESEDERVKKQPRLDVEEESEDEEVKKQPRLSSDEEEENDQDDEVEKQPRLSSDEEEESEDERVKKQPRLDEEEENEDDEVQKQPRLSSDEDEESEDEKVQKQPQLSSDEEKESEDDEVQKLPPFGEEEESEDDEVQKMPRFGEEEESEDEEVQKQPRLGSDEEEESEDDEVQKLPRFGEEEESEDEEVQKQPGLSSDEATSAWKNEHLPPPMREDDSKERPLYELGDVIKLRYQILSKLGEGTYSQVLECYDEETQVLVAIKVPKSTIDQYESNYEINLLQHLANGGESSSGCVQFRGSFAYKDRIWIVFEMLGPSLRDLLDKNQCSPVPLELVWELGRQLLESVAYVHDMTIIHGDLKPKNLLLVSTEFVEKSSSGEVQFRYWPESSDIKLIDFGSSIFHSDLMKVKHNKAVVVTRSYRAPEIILGLGWSYPCDLWSVGCILIELCTGKRLFITDNDLEHLAMMERVLGQLPKHMTQRASQEAQKHFREGSILNWPQGASTSDSIRAVNKHKNLEVLVTRHVKSSKRSELIDLLSGLLKYDPSERLTARQARKHQFFTNPPEESHKSLGTSVH